MGKFTQRFRAWLGRKEAQPESRLDDHNAVHQNLTQSRESQTTTTAGMPKLEALPPHNDDPGIDPPAYGELAGSTAAIVAAAICTTTAALPAAKVSTATAFITSGIIRIASAAAAVPAADAPAFATVVTAAMTNVFNSLAAQPPVSSGTIICCSEIGGLPAIVPNILGPMRALRGKSQQVYQDVYPLLCYEIGMAIVATPASSKPAVAAALIAAVTAITNAVTTAPEASGPAVAAVYDGYVRHLADEVGNRMAALLPRQTPDLPPPYALL
ncbi:hypothetical protein B0T24DRAFT_594785 [Lasiosphaeria ovina]|uniref:Uncharacterized protein n=1 Tax=Lasiosphaeria ovina TaxID=92902 RepID=A0AAE0K7D5_9PEZI|nr:hypothetical protein B0T24DRAFT_594785 [Lasiosphaeria ovina]